MITEAEAKKRLCVLMGEVNEAVNGFDEAADCFCPDGAYAGKPGYSNTGAAIAFIEARDRWEASKP